MSETEEPLSLAIARANGWTYGLGPCFIEGCTKEHWRSPDGEYCGNSVPHVRDPAIWGTLLAEMFADPRVKLVIETDLDGPCVELLMDFGDGAGRIYIGEWDGPNLGLSVAKAWLAWWAS